MLLASGCGILKESKLLSPTENGLVEIAPRVYVSAEKSDELQKKLLVSLASAKGQIIEIYGSVISNPNVYAFYDREHFESFNGFGDGRAVFSFGNSGIMLIPKSIIPEAIAHEWSHNELLARVGRSGLRTIPVWFNEGLAVITSKLPRHSEEVWAELKQDGVDLPKIGELETIDQWIAANRKTYENQKGRNVVYTAAGHEVRAWFKQVGQAGLLELLDVVKAGGNFNEQCREIIEATACGTHNTAENCSKQTPEKSSATYGRR